MFSYTLSADGAAAAAELGSATVGRHRRHEVATTAAANLGENNFFPQSCSELRVMA